VLVLTAVSLVIASAGAAGADPAVNATSYQKLAEQAPCRWSDRVASLTYSVGCYLRDFQVEIIVPKAGAPEEFTIRIVEDGKPVYAFHGHWGTVFTRLGDVLCVADFCPISDGCKVVAVDLKSRKPLWNTTLGALGGVDHSKYRNQVAIDTDGKAIIVRGKESGGRYIEYLSKDTGKTIGHKIYRDR
jgi:hypothetical protein